MLVIMPLRSVIVSLSTQIMSDRNTDQREHNGSCEKRRTHTNIHLNWIKYFIHKQNNLIFVSLNHIFKKLSGPYYLPNSRLTLIRENISSLKLGWQFIHQQQKDKSLTARFTI